MNTKPDKTRKLKIKISKQSFINGKERTLVNNQEEIKNERKVMSQKSSPNIAERRNTTNLLYWI